MQPQPRHFHRLRERRPLAGSGSVGMRVFCFGSSCFPCLFYFLKPRQHLAAWVSRGLASPARSIPAANSWRCRRRKNLNIRVIMFASDRLSPVSPFWALQEGCTLPLYLIVSPSLVLPSSLVSIPGSSISLLSLDNAQCPGSTAAPWRNLHLMLELRWLRMFSPSMSI